MTHHLFKLIFCLKIKFRFEKLIPCAIIVMIVVKFNIPSGTSLVLPGFVWIFKQKKSQMIHRLLYKRKDTMLINNNKKKLDIVSIVHRTLFLTLIVWDRVPNWYYQCTFSNTLKRYKRYKTIYSLVDYESWIITYES